MNLKADVLGIGVINITSGKTMYDWSIYDWPEGCVYLTSSNRILYASPETFQIGDNVTLIGNDSRRKLQEVTVVDVCKCVYSEVVEMLWKHEMDYKPKRAFAKARWSKKLQSSYSVKGTYI